MTQYIEVSYVDSTVILISRSSYKKYAELPIATSIIKTTLSELEKASGKEVLELHLEIGKLAGIELDSFLFTWKQCIINTSLENVRLQINGPCGKALCLECHKGFELQHIFDNCVFCNNPFKEIRKEQELKIKKLHII